MSSLESSGPNDVELDPEPFTYQSLNKDPGLVFNGSELPSNKIIGDPFISLTQIMFLLRFEPPDLPLTFFRFSTPPW